MLPAVRICLAFALFKVSVVDILEAVDKPADATYDDIVDDVLTGAYLITAIRHKIDRIGYVMKMEIVKNGLAKSIGIVDDGVNDDIK